MKPALNFRLVALCAALAGPASAPALAGGVTAYLPLNLEPEIEREVERVLILADEPILKRPFAVNLVEDALPQACEVDAVLCEKVRRYLVRYSRDYAVTHASATVSADHGSKTALSGIVPDAYGEPINSKWDLSIQAFVQPNDYVLAAVGADAYSGRTVPVGSMLSLGGNWAQVDFGYRDHWFSPLTDSSMIMSTEAPTMPSVTVSNYEPLGRIGFQYEMFLARMSTDTDIVYDGKVGPGHPRLFGAQFSIEPFSGWSLGVNRLIQYGGADGLPDSSKFLLKDFFHGSGIYQLQSNQEASYVSRFLFPGKTPFAVYVQYAGENTEDGGSYLLGNSSLSAGIDIPKIWRFFDLTYEVSEWQNTWYTHFIFQQGLTDAGLVVGNWGADQRIFNDGVGARSQMLRVGWYPSFGGYLEERVRTLVNQEYFGDQNRIYNPGLPAYPYKHYVDFTLRYSRPWNGVTVGGQLFGGRDVYGRSFSQLSAFVRYGGDQSTRDDGSVDGEELAPHDEHGAELFVDAGVGVSKVRIDLEQGVPSKTTNAKATPHAGVGARRAVSENNDLGVRLEVDQVNGHDLLSLRALDWRYRFEGPVAVTGFAGAARYNLATPAFSLFAGVGAQYRDFLPHWDLNLDFRYDQNIARDHVLATDIEGVRPNSFYKIEGLLLYASRRF